MAKEKSKVDPGDESARVKALQAEKTKDVRIRKLCQGNKVVAALYEENQALKAQLAKQGGK